MSNNYKYHILSKAEIKEWEESGRERPACTSCRCTHDTIVGWKATDKKTGEEIYTCPECLDCYTDISAYLDIYEMDWTNKKNLKRIYVKECESCGRKLPSADRHMPLCVPNCAE